jgi:hypothetical protein
MRFRHSHSVRNRTSNPSPQIEVAEAVLDGAAGPPGLDPGQDASSLGARNERDRIRIERRRTPRAGLSVVVEATGNSVCATEDVAPLGVVPYRQTDDVALAHRQRSYGASRKCGAP